ncbi:sporulation protein [Peribacillus cavernae]|uniref:Sporulation protein n=1 Tax=Peribacillus cavernae TaxID=1674310 RepID=A0A433HHW9_9BACI|nr:Spo0B C-terminal domain-containing protein [Peribacillus cavernae]MDQ0219361.1 stage 0 sporulation protein B (sporulation initiation phosphotransferase) [Peribacillus cavernae]RUQ27762.1 sporulation protein [Peribacillus cavernae]
MSKDWKTVEILSHTRHDWLNRLQLIKGNIELDKIDRVKAIIDEIIIETQHESRLSNLNMPNFVETLLTANWRTLPLRIELEVVSLQHGCRDMDDFMASWIEDLFLVLKESVDDYDENVLAVSIDENKERKIRLSFDLQGTIKKETILRDFLIKPLNENMAAAVCKISSNETLFYIEIDYDDISD